MPSCRNNTKCGNLLPHQFITGQAPYPLKKFQYAFGDLVAVRIPPELREWKFDLLNDVGVYIDQPEYSQDGRIIYFPHSGATSIRTDLHLIELNEELFRRYFARRDNIRNTHQSAWKEITDIVGDMEVNFDSKATEYGDESFIIKAPLIETEEILPSLVSPRLQKALIQKI